MASRTLELILKVTNQSNNALDQIRQQLAGLGNLGVKLDFSQALSDVDRLVSAVKAYSESQAQSNKAAIEAAQAVREQERAAQEQLKTQQQVERLSQSQLKTEQDKIRLQDAQARSLRTAQAAIEKEAQQAERQAAAAEKAAQAQVVAAQKSAIATAELARTLGISVDEADQLAKKLNLSAENSLKAARTFQGTQGSSPQARENLITQGFGANKEGVQALAEIEKQAEKNKQAIAGSFKPPLGAAEGITKVAFAFNQIGQAIQLAFAAAKPFYDFTLGAAEKFNAQILSSQTNLASATRIFQGGREITDPTEKINASKGALTAALKQVEKDTESLVGVTSQKVNELFQITLTNAADLNNQSKQFPDPIAAATQLTKGWAASLKVIGVPLDQARQEINSIIKGNIDQNSILAKNLGITNDQVNKWKAQGILVDELNKRLQTFVAGNAIAANSIEGVASNIQDIFERVGREAGTPLLQPFVDGLNQVFNLLKSNEKNIVGTFQQVADLLGSNLTSVAQSLAPVAQTTLDIIGKATPLVVNLFDITGKGFATVAAGLGPVINGLGQVIAKATEGLAAISELIQLNQTNADQKDLDILKGNSGVLTDEALKEGQALKELNKIKENGGTLTEEQAKREKVLQAQSTNTIKAIDEQIAAYKKIATASPEVKQQRDAEIASLERLKASLANSSGGLQLQGKALTDLGTVYQQTNAKIAETANIIKTEGGGDPARFEKGIKERIEALKRARELGTITPEDAQKELEAIANNTKASVESQQNAAKAITDIKKQELDLQSKDSDAQIATIQAQVAARTITESDGAKQVTELKKKQLDAQIADVEEAIAREQELRKKAIEQAQKDVTNAEADVAKLRESGVNPNSNQFKAAESEVAAKRKVAETLQNEEGANIRQLETQRKKLLADRQKSEIDGEKAIADAKLKELEIAEKKATDVSKLAETTRQIEIQKLYDKGLISKEEADQKKLESSKQTTAKELELAKQNLAALEALPKATGTAGEEQEAKVRAAKQKTADLTLKLAQQEQAIQEAVIKVIQKKIDQQLQGIKNAVQSEVQGLERQASLYDSIGKFIDQQQKLLQARQNLQKAIADSQQAQYSTAQKLLDSQTSAEQKAVQQGRDSADRAQKRVELQEKLGGLTADQVNAEVGAIEDQLRAGVKLDEATKSRLDLLRQAQDLNNADAAAEREKEKEKLAIQAAQAKLVALEQEQKLQKVSLELEIQKNDILLQQEKIKNRIAQAQNKADVAQARAEIAKLQASKDATPEQIAAAQQALQAKQEQGLALQEQAGSLGKQEAAQASLAEQQRAALGLQQQSAKLGAKADLAALTPGTEDDRALFKETLQNLKQPSAEIVKAQKLDQQLQQLQQQQVKQPIEAGRAIDLGARFDTALSRFEGGIKNLLIEVQKQGRSVAVTNNISGQIDPDIAAKRATQATIDQLTKAFQSATT